MEENDEDLLKRPPRNPDQSLLSKRVLKIIGFEGILIAFFTLISYHLGLRTSHYVARTMVLEPFVWQDSFIVLIAGEQNQSLKESQK